MTKISDLIKDEERTKKLQKALKINKTNILIDYSKTHLQETDLKEIKTILNKHKISKKIKQMTQGDKINYTENKQVLHTLLRNKQILNCVSYNITKIFNESLPTFCSCLKNCDCDQRSKTECDKLSKQDVRNVFREMGNFKRTDVDTRNLECLGKKYEFDFLDLDCDLKKRVCIDLFKMFLLDRKIQKGDLKGCSNKRIKNVVHIGIGGSFLGPKLLCEAFKYIDNGIDVKFVSNIDPEECLSVLKSVNFEETLFVIVSKSFKTQETLSNMELVCEYYTNMKEKQKNDSKKRKKDAEGNSDQIYDKEDSLYDNEITDFEALPDIQTYKQSHFIAVSANDKEPLKHNIYTTLKMGEYVGGRYSIWSSAGISVVLKIGFKNFLKFLRGAQAIDEHFMTEEEFENNVPILHAMIELFYNKEGYESKAILVYDELMQNLWKYLQQAEMESNGKSARREDPDEESDSTSDIEEQQINHKDAYKNSKKDAQKDSSKYSHKDSKKNAQEDSKKDTSNDSNKYTHKDGNKDSVAEESENKPKKSIQKQPVLTPKENSKNTSKTSQKLDSKTSQKLDSKTSQKLDSKTSQKLDSKTSQKIESNGAHSEIKNKDIYSKNTSMIIWGDTGTNCQHSFFQLIHQGTRKILSEFIINIQNNHSLKTGKKNKNLLFSNFLAQSEALMIGKKEDDQNKHFEGNKPSISIIIDELSPESLGVLLAIYEHKIFVQGIVWKINSFDQFGVELGKKLSDNLFKEIESKKIQEHDSSTKKLLEFAMKIDGIKEKGKER